MVDLHFRSVHGDSDTARAVGVSVSNLDQRGKANGQGGHAATSLTVTLTQAASNVTTTPRLASSPAANRSTVASASTPCGQAGAPSAARSRGGNFFQQSRSCP